MTVIKRFGEDDTALVDCMDQLVEILVQLLEEKQDPAVKEEEDPVTSGDDFALRSEGNRVIHVVGKNQESGD